MAAAMIEATVLPEKVKNLLILFYPPLHRMMINTDDLFC